MRRNVYRLIADHGNAEKMIAPDGGKHTAHTCYKVYGRDGVRYNICWLQVPFTCSSDKYKFVDAPGMLIDLIMVADYSIMVIID